MPQSITAKVAQLQAAQKAAMEDGYARHLARPELKTLMSLVPASEPPELLTTLLRSFYDAGANDGSAIVASLLARFLLEGGEE